MPPRVAPPVASCRRIEERQEGEEERGALCGSRRARNEEERVNRLVGAGGRGEERRWRWRDRDKRAATEKTTQERAGALFSPDTVLFHDSGVGEGSGRRTDGGGSNRGRIL